MSFSYYGPLCTTVYDLTKPVGHSLGGDIEFYRHYLQGCKGRILEAMSGSGRMLIPLLEAGLKVDGLDYSTDMIDSCRSRCTERALPMPELFVADLEKLDLPYRYETIIIPGGSPCSSFKTERLRLTHCVVYFNIWNLAADLCLICFYPM